MRRRTKHALGTLLFYIGVVTVPTTMFLLYADISPTVLSVSQAVVVRLVLIVQGVPILLLLALGAIIRWRTPQHMAAFRATLIAGIPVFIVLHVTGTLFVATVDRLTDVAMLRAMALVLYFGAAGGFAIGMWLLCRRREERYAELVKAVGVVGVAGVVLVTLMLGTSVETPTYRLTDPPTPRDVPSLPPMFVIVFDEVSYPALFNEHGRVDAERYPNFARLAAASMVFTDATTNYFFTRHAVPSLVEDLASIGASELITYIQHRGSELALRLGCGVHYECRGIDRLASEQQDTILRQMVFSTLGGMVPPPFEIVLGPLLDSTAGVAGVPTAAVDRNAGHLFHAEHFEAFMEEIREGPRDDTIYVFHTLVTHFPYIFTPQGALSSEPFTLGPDGRFVPARFVVSPGERDDRLFQAYSKQLSYGDLLLGRFLDALEATSVLDEATIVVTADHGIRLQNVVDDGPIPVDSWATHIPLIIRVPGVGPSVSNALVQQVDLGALMIHLLATEGGSESHAASVEARTPWFLVDGRWVYHRVGGEWTLVGTLPPGTTIDRELHSCLSNPYCPRYEGRSIRR